MSKLKLDWNIVVQWRVYKIHLSTTIKAKWPNSKRYPKKSTLKLLSNSKQSIRFFHLLIFLWRSLILDRNQRNQINKLSDAFQKVLQPLLNVAACLCGISHDRGGNDDRSLINRGQDRTRKVQVHFTSISVKIWSTFPRVSYSIYRFLRYMKFHLWSLSALESRLSSGTCTNKLWQRTNTQ